MELQIFTVQCNQKGILLPQKPKSETASCQICVMSFLQMTFSFCPSSSSQLWQTWWKRVSHSQYQTLALLTVWLHTYVLVLWAAYHLQGELLKLNVLRV